MQHIQLRNIKVNQIQIFLKAVHCGSFSGAAESLHVTQPMVSKTIQKFKEEQAVSLYVECHAMTQLIKELQDDKYDAILK